MKVSRRDFVTAIPAIGVMIVSMSGSANGQVDLVPPPLADPGVLGSLDFQRFHQMLGTEFLFLNKDRVLVPLRLEAVVDQRPLARQKWGKGKENFMLKFSGHWRFPLPQNTYSVSHFSLKDFQLFITNGGLVDGEYRYVAIINRMDD